MKKILALLLLLLFANCNKDNNPVATPTEYTFYYLTEEPEINARSISSSAQLNPKALAVSNNKLYVCNDDALEVFDATTLAYIKTISSYTKASTTIVLKNLSSVCVDNGRIYVGSIDSQIFVFDEVTHAAINTIGNGQWWTTFVHVYGLAAKDGLLFVKEKEKSIKVLETAKITATSNWNIQPLTQLSTQDTKWSEIYAMDVDMGYLVVAGKNTNSFLYYSLATIRANALKTGAEPVEPLLKKDLKNSPLGISFGADWALTSEVIDEVNHIRLYPKKQFSEMSFNPIVAVTDVMGKNPFGNVVSVAQANNRLYLADNGTKKIRTLKINTSKLSEIN